MAPASTQLGVLSLSSSFLNCCINSASMPAKFGAYFLDQTALNPKVRLETMALMKPLQLKLSSPAEAIATPAYTPASPLYIIFMIFVKSGNPVNLLSTHSLWLIGGLVLRSTLEMSWP